MKVKILMIALLILFTCVTDLVTTEPGGGGTPGGNCPCYYVGQFVNEYGWWQSAGYYIRIVDTYIGNCQIRSDWYGNGIWFQYTVSPGGCTCACGVP
ncbi:MAG TPA: hypothetical protein VK255_03910, partial [Patescibacteria group bacterium]|nr:hypothetical protein [Patescibacteria group bacterium]